MSTRRDFIAMLLGTPLAIACRGEAPRRLPPGSIIDTGMARAHAAVRDGSPPQITQWRRHRVVIVGSGIAGLTAAWELRRRGIRDVVVLELDDAIGGTSRSGTSPVTAYPWGAHYIVAPQREQVALIDLLREMNAIEGVEANGTPIVDELLRCREPEERVWYLGKWWDGLYLDAGSNAADKQQLAAFNAEVDRWSAWRDAQGRRAFTIPRSLGSDAPEVRALDRISFAAWLDERNLTSPRLRWVCDYACRDDYALTAAQTSAWAGLFYFAARQSEPGAEAQSVVTWPDGNGALVRHLAASTTIERGVAVLDITESADGVAVTAVGPQGPLGIRADAVIVATPTFVANRIVRARRGQPAGEYGAWAVANVHLRARPIERGRGAPPAWDNVFRDSPSLGYVSATHQRGRDRGATVWTWYYPFTDEDTASVRKKLAGAGYAEWADTVLADLARAHPDVRDHVDHIEVAFWGHGMVRPRVGAIWNDALAARAKPIGRIHFANTDLSGFAIFEEAFDHGLRAAREVAEGMPA
ncbi:MAG TPA: FAD-dependent oxidoreductase [Kofleriaceae bacterium]